MTTVETHLREIADLADEEPKRSIRNSETLPQEPSVRSHGRAVSTN